MNSLAAAPADFTAYVRDEAPQTHQLNLMIDGMRCVACAFSIEAALNAEANVSARINVTDRRLDLRWQGAPARGNALVRRIQDMGYGVHPLAQAAAMPAEKQEEQMLFHAMTVAGFASANIMLISFALWFPSPDAMGIATRTLLHWLMALIALPCVIYAGQPFFGSAWRVLRHGRTNMDVPISLALILATSVSLVETAHRASHAYFDSAVMLLFLLLIGRWLDRRARGRARGAAQSLLLMMNGTADIVEKDGQRAIPIEQIRPGMLLNVPAGARIGADGEVVSGSSQIDASMMTGETFPVAAAPGARVFAGTLNLAAAIQVRASSAGHDSLLGDIVRLMQQAEQRQSRYVRLADRVARAYTPVVHLLALLSFLLWWQIWGAPWQQAVMVATTVLIITCPCALALAIPAVQVVTSSALFRQGILLKSADALERLAQVDTVYFDKTGTLTLGVPRWIADASITRRDAISAAQLAHNSNHVLARALAQAVNPPPLAITAHELPGLGMEAVVAGTRWRLGRRSWLGGTPAIDDDALELWFQRGAASPVRFRFADAPREDAAEALQRLHQAGYAVVMLSGDRSTVANAVAAGLGIRNVHAELLPQQKVSLVEAARHAGRKVLMVGDGLNDAPALAAAHVSMSPATGIDITQNAADLVFQGSGLKSVPMVLAAARQAQRLVRQNLAASLLYNLLALPLAISGQVTPLIAAIAMSSSSMLVIRNALRAGRPGARP